MTKKPRKSHSTTESKIDKRLREWFESVEKESKGKTFEEVPVDLDMFLYDSMFLNLSELSVKQYEFVRHGTQIYKEKELIVLGWAEASKKEDSTEQEQSIVEREEIGNKEDSTEQESTNENSIRKEQESSVAAGSEKEQEYGYTSKETSITGKQEQESEEEVGLGREPSESERSGEIVSRGSLPVGELVAWWGKGSGKDFCSSIIQCRIAYLLLSLVNPQKYFSQAQTSSIDMLNMAYSGDQAMNVFFKQFSEMVDQCRWFRDRCHIGVGKVQFDKRICAYSGNSFEEAFEGKNLIVAVLDEISAFKTKIELEHMAIRKLRAPRYSAESVYDMAKSSVVSRFPNGVGKVISLSFSRFKNDFIEQLYERGKNDPYCYVSKGCTWEVNPFRKKEDFADEFKKNPERAESRYACNPSSVEGGYFRNKEAVHRAFPVIEEGQVPTTYDIVPELAPWFQCKHSALCSVHIDLGLKKDKTGVCMSHVAGVVQETKTLEDGTVMMVELPVVEVDLLTSFIAPVGGEIDFAEVRKIMMAVVGLGFRIGICTLDSYQSADFIQSLNKLGIPTALRSVDRNLEAYDCLKELVYGGRLRGYSYVRRYMLGDKPVEENEIITELLNLILIGGRKVQHPAYGGKDVADAVAGSVKGAIDFGMVGIGSPPESSQVVRDQRTVDIVRSEQELVSRIRRTPDMPGNLSRNSVPDNVGYRGMPGGR